MERPPPEVVPDHLAEPRPPVAVRRRRAVALEAAVLEEGLDRVAPPVPVQVQADLTLLCGDDCSVSHRVLPSGRGGAYRPSSTSPGQARPRASARPCGRGAARGRGGCVGEREEVLARRATMGREEGPRSCPHGSGTREFSTAARIGDPHTSPAQPVSETLVEEWQ